MENTSENRHVDAGKTTLAESLLYHTGSIRKMGRVDHQDAFLDTNEMERARGITIFSKQAVFDLKDKEITLLDTPGHVDFSAEMERTLQVLDYGILIISGPDGVQGHVETLWRLLNQYHIPTILFVNKMDQEGTEKKKILGQLRKRLHEHCIDFSQDREREEFLEETAMCGEPALEEYLETGNISQKKLRDMVKNRELFPCFFGSALKSQGITEFLKGLEELLECPSYPETFGAKVYKISRDDKGTRLTHMKITGGSLKVKQLITGEGWEEKADQIRIYDGQSFQTVEEAGAGCVCAVTGLTKTWSGEGLGEEPVSAPPVLTPVLTYEIRLPQGTDVHGMLIKLRQLEEEIPELQILWNEQLGEIHAQVMGEVQIEILKQMILERFGIEVEFGSGNIVYRGAGLVFAADCSEDILDRNWQRLILTHLEEKHHLGVLTGSEITDMKITLIAGRAHLKHTEGGDFRQATYRAVRQGLRKAESILLEPVYEYSLEVPQDAVGRAMADIQRMSGTFSTPDIQGEYAFLTGTAPVSEMRDYQREVTAYTRGRGHLSFVLKGYEPCHNSQEIIEAAAYDPEGDLENPTGSVFCSHGAGFNVPWDQVEEYAHIDTGFGKEEEPEMEIQSVPVPSFEEIRLTQQELEEIFVRTYGPIKRPRYNQEEDFAVKKTPEKTRRYKKQEPEKEYLLVDGYNIIFAWEDLQELAKVNIEGARNKLMDMLCNYQGYKKCTLILVFDAYKVEGNQGEVQKYHNIYVVYTKEAETADQYIEKTVHEIGRKYHVTVATSDALEQVIIMGQGAARLSARNLREEIQMMNREIRNHYLEKTKKSGSYLFESLPEHMTDFMEDVRLGRKNFEDLEKKS